MIETDGILKKQISDLFVDCDMYVYVEEQRIRYFDKNGHWLGSYELKTEKFWWSSQNFNKFFDEEIKGNFLVISELLKPILEVAINRKVSATDMWNDIFRGRMEEITKKWSSTLLS